MANCHKCGKAKIRKRADGLRWCKRCGAMPGIGKADRSGFIAAVALTIGNPFSQEQGVQK